MWWSPNETVPEWYKCAGKNLTLGILWHLKYKSNWAHLNYCCENIVWKVVHMSHHKIVSLVCARKFIKQTSQVVTDWLCSCYIQFLTLNCKVWVEILSSLLFLITVLVTKAWKFKCLSIQTFSEVLSKNVSEWFKYLTGVKIVLKVKVTYDSVTLMTGPEVVINLGVYWQWSHVRRVSLGGVR